MTWAGKLLRPAHLVNEDLASNDMSFAEPYIKKRRDDCSLPDEGDGMSVSSMEKTSFTSVIVKMNTR